MTTENLIKLMDEMESSDGIYLLDSLSEDSGFLPVLVNYCTWF